MKVLIQGDPVMKQVYEHYESFCSDEELRRIDEIRQRHLHDYVSDVEDAYERANIKSKIETIFMFLSDHSTRIPKRLKEKVQEITDIEKLNKLIKAAAKCENLKEFERLFEN